MFLASYNLPWQVPSSFEVLLTCLCRVFLETLLLLDVSLLAVFLICLALEEEEEELDEELLELPEDLEDEEELREDLEADYCLAILLCLLSMELFWIASLLAVFLICLALEEEEEELDEELLEPELLEVELEDDELCLRALFNEWLDETALVCLMPLVKECLWDALATFLA